MRKRISAAKDPPGCRLVGRNVEDPERFGVAVFDENGELTDTLRNRKTRPLRSQLRHLSVR